MDGDGHAAKVFSWTGEEDEGPDAPAFDPAAVLRAIEAEDGDDEDDGIAARAAIAEVTPDLGSAVRAALAFGAGTEEMAVEEDAGIPPPVSDADVAIADGTWDADDRDAAEETGAVSLETGDLPPVSEHIEDDWGAQAQSHAPEDHWSGASAAEDDDAAMESAPVMHFPTIDELDVPGRKPRIALMGEFSAGKSTLSNLLIGAAPLPMQVTATQLPPVWISWGDGPAYREDIWGATHPVDIARLSEIDPSETRVIRIFEQSEILESCDIIDMPGISDPNMDAEVWERVIGRADGVIWCTHATQAWRQTEASVWESLNPKLFDTSLLLITRFDKLLNENDRARVIRRVERETEGLFAARLPISLTRALAAGDDPELLEHSGAAAFRARLCQILERVARDIGTTAGIARTRETLARDGRVVPLAAARRETGAAGGRVLPRRVRPISQMAPTRD